ncbi:hypothetical protein E1B28_003321 [Marasmius oreades]|uniref:Thioredoxin-like protein n=1 Tax=Marasmius oreades TaxID=181124 RepID=A0A9P7RMC2_9AGAR|nr:uncharacterized protein E1B28_003321 [Marasmius oreades]KAG7085780.1 hypothetical protein E1B28_003321 [Marasmius oreades]
MFSAFRRVVPEISIFHNPSSPPSTKALSLLKAAVSGPYPLTKSDNPPLDFKLEVVEAPPTADQLQTILSFSLKDGSASSMFLSAHPSSPFTLSTQSPSLSKITEVGSKNPSALKWPIVVDWTAGKACVGDVECVKGILEEVRKKRDGETNGEDIEKPKGWFS